MIVKEIYFYRQPVKKNPTKVTRQANDSIRNKLYCETGMMDTRQSLSC